MLSRHQHPLQSRQISRGWFPALAQSTARHGCPLPGSAALANSCFLLAAVSTEGRELPRAAGLGQQPQEVREGCFGTRAVIKLTPGSSGVPGRMLQPRVLLSFPLPCSHLLSSLNVPWTTPVSQRGSGRICSHITMLQGTGGPWAVPDPSIPT